jgi:hypothetical protein
MIARSDIVDKNERVSSRLISRISIGDLAEAIVAKSISRKDIMNKLGVVQKFQLVQAIDAIKQKAKAERIANTRATGRPKVQDGYRYQTGRLCLGEVVRSLCSAQQKMVNPEALYTPQPKHNSFIFTKDTGINTVRSAEKLLYDWSMVMSATMPAALFVEFELVGVDSPQYAAMEIIMNRGQGSRKILTFISIYSYFDISTILFHSSFPIHKTTTKPSNQTNIK